MEKVKYRYNRWRLALGRLVNLRYINRWIIFCADLFISLCKTKCFFTNCKGSENQLTIK